MARTRNRPRHPNKEIEAAVQHAEDRGWTVTLSTGHAWGRIRCPHGQGGCQRWVYSTPSDPTAHARFLRRTVDNCPHVGG